VAPGDEGHIGIGFHAIQHRLEALAGLGETDDLRGTVQLPVQYHRGGWLGVAASALPTQASLPSEKQGSVGALLLIGQAIARLPGMKAGTANLAVQTLRRPRRVGAEATGPAIGRSDALMPPWTQRTSDSLESCRG
jgi:hypothetical protein